MSYWSQGGNLSPYPRQPCVTPRSSIFSTKLSLNKMDTSINPEYVGHSLLHSVTRDDSPRLLLYLNTHGHNGSASLATCHHLTLNPFGQFHFVTAFNLTLKQKTWISSIRVFFKLPRTKIYHRRPLVMPC